MAEPVGLHRRRRRIRTGLEARRRGQYPGPGWICKDITAERQEAEGSVQAVLGTADRRSGACSSSCVARELGGG